MKNHKSVPPRLAAAALCLFASLAIATQASAADRSAGSGANDPACSVHLWDGKNFSDSDIVIRGPGKFGNLRDLPGANGKDWNDEADSLKVGSAATVKAWKKKDFQGASQTYGPGSEHPKLDDEPSSLEISCQ